jgi:2'-5' RNA ligase
VSLVRNISGDEPMRLFIAINFNDDTRSSLLALRDELRSRSERGNFSLPDNLHLTLVFLGECDLTQTAAVKASMDTVRFEPIEVVIDRIDRFRRGGGDIWWAGLRYSRSLSEVQRDLTDSLTAAGFRFDKRGYSPHITLGREIVTDTKPWPISPFAETAGRIDLMKSERISGKLTYSVIYRRGTVTGPA